MSVLDLLRRSHPNVDSPTYRRLAGVVPETERSETRPSPATSEDDFLERLAATRDIEDNTEALRAIADLAHEHALRMRTRARAYRERAGAADEQASKVFADAKQVAP